VPCAASQSIERPAAAGDVAHSARAAFDCATSPIKLAVTAGETADQQLTALVRGFADLVASEWGRSLALLDLTGLPEAVSNRVRRHRTMLATLARNVLAAGHTDGEFEVPHLDGEVRRWIQLADSLPRWLARVPEFERRTTARFVFEGLAETYRESARTRWCRPRPGARERSARS
jgi:hypothetical protein